MRRPLLGFTGAVALAAALMMPACGGDDGGVSGPSGQPQVLACNTVSYQGITYSSLGCAPGIASFTSTITTQGRTVCFNVTCSGGCVSAVRVC